MNKKNNLAKYRAIDSAHPNELEKIRATVLEDTKYLPKYHIYPKTGLLNDPNGLVFDGENYHIFYQWYPFDSIHGMKHWAHLITKDFINFSESIPIIPAQKFEIHGCYSGGALINNENLLCFYTGNTRQGEKLNRVSYQNVAIIDRATNEIKEKYCILKTPLGYTEHFRDPKPWIEQDKIKFICASQRDNLTGCATLFEYNSDNHTSKFLGELNIKGINNENVFMWECPDLFTLNNRDVFIWCPQGIKPDNNRFHNIYSCTYAIGHRIENNFSVIHWDELDRGFDFYAPQTFSGTNETILIGWIGVPNATYPSDIYSWQGMLTLPRVLEIKNNKLYQSPHKQVYSLIKNESKLELIAGAHNVNNLSECYIKSNIANKEFELNLFSSNDEQVKLSYKNNIFKVDRSKTMQTEFMQQYGSVREVEMLSLNMLEIFIDNSVIEIYINNGEFTLTMRFFMQENNNNLELMGDIILEVFALDNIHLWN
ncbi:hypothetical protein AN641_01825 [Candidatus Epulonipiscioides gigas]|nr:hypothetical protein AN641_01825 [Epulopiscium sp. SCG-C07WGA-EpuloA2]